MSPQINPKEDYMRVLSFSQSMTDGLPQEIHIVPIGEWKERGFRIDAADCADIIRNFEAFGIKLVIDYEHQSLNSGFNGQPAPAAGWIGKLELRENGVWATDIEWTEAAKQMIEAKSYRYISPVIVFDDHDPHTDSWIGCSLHSIALTNTPYFRDDLEPIVNSRYANTKPAQAGANKETNMTLEEQVAALTAETTAQAAKINELEASVAAKNDALAELETVKLVDDAIAAKKLLPANRDTGLFMAKQGKEVFEKFVAATKVADLTQTTQIPETNDTSDDPKADYQKLMKDPAKAEKFKAENPEKFQALRKAALYGGK
jgi:phage I-like protein